MDLPIKRKSTKEVFVANASTKQGKHKTELPLEGLSLKARAADNSEAFRTTLISGSKGVDNGSTEILDRHGVKVYKDEDVLILVKGKPVMIEKQDNNGRFKIPLMQYRGQWQPRVPTRQQRRKLEQANSVYNLPSTEQVI